MKNLLTRSATGVVFVGVIIGAILWHPYAFGLLFLFITIVGLLEFYKLVGKEKVKPQKITGLALGIGLYCVSSPDAFSILLSPFFTENDLGDFLIGFNILACLPVLLFVVFIIELFRKTETPFLNIAYTILGVVYIALPFMMLNAIASSDNYKLLVLGFFLLIWANDSFAYAVGSLIGKHKLFERVSPKKTWEGTLGGVILCFVCAWLISIWFTDYTLTEWLIVAGICSVFGSMGDLIQSRLKRQYGVKDSGSIMPGHGGILDRFDGVLLATPFFYAFIILFVSN